MATPIFLKMVRISFFQRNVNIRNYVFDKSDLGEIDAEMEALILKYQEVMAKKRKL